MKICWDNLETLIYNKKTGKWYKGTKTYIEIEHCYICNEPFLGRKNSKCCSKECQYKYYIGEKNPFYGKKHTKEIKEKISKNRKGKSKGKDRYNYNPYLHKNIPTYDNYAPQLEWVEKVRRNQDDPNILEVTCSKCGEWYIPKISSVNSRIQILKGNINYKGEQHFYCSNQCKKSCSIYGKSPEQVMIQDAFNAGQLSWLELGREIQPELRDMVLERDGYQCTKCENTNDLQCHHIYPVNIEPLLSADMDTCMTLCPDCHKEVHQKDGCRYNQLKLEICQ